MEDNDILYQMKSLFRDIHRNYFQDDGSSLSPTQIEIMSYISKHENEVIYQRDLESILNLRRATVSEVLKTMEKNELIKREVNDEDLRSKKIVITWKAKEIFKTKKDKMKKLNKTITKGITSKEKNLFIGIINKMKNNIKEEDV